MTAQPGDLVDRVRAVLPWNGVVREVPMFGGRSFMVDGALVVAVRRGGHLLVRIDPARRDELLDLPGAAPAVMGNDRPMGRGWISVSPAGLADGDRLAFWITVGLDHAGPRPPGGR